MRKLSVGLLLLLLCISAKVETNKPLEKLMNKFSGAQTLVKVPYKGAVSSVSVNMDIPPMLNLFGDILFFDVFPAYSMLDEMQQNVYYEICSAVRGRVYDFSLSNPIDLKTWEAARDAVWADGVFSGIASIQACLDQRGYVIGAHVGLSRKTAKLLVSDTMRTMIPVLEEAMNFETDLERVRFCHDYICQTTQYSQTDFSSEAFGALIQHKAQAAGYARAMQWMLKQLFIPCLYVEGKLHNGKSHAWNMVCIDNEWYNMDICWDDASGDYSYSFLTDAQISRSRSWELQHPLSISTTINAENIDQMVSYYKENQNYFAMLQSENEIPLMELNESPDEARLSFIMEAKTYIGTPYEFGGTTRTGIDCSALAWCSARDALSKNLPRTSMTQLQRCQYVSDGNKQPGDLLFFRTDSTKRISHVAIYIGDNKFIHAASKGVIISKLNGYWRRVYVCAGRFLPEGSQITELMKNVLNEDWPVDDDFRPMPDVILDFYNRTQLNSTDKEMMVGESPERILIDYIG